MNTMRARGMHGVTLLACALPMAGASDVANPQEFPSKPLRIFAGGAGGNADFAARLIATGISPALGQPVVVENRPATITPDIVARSAPDGYTIHATGTVAVVAPFISKVQYDPVRDFAPITLAALSPLVLVVHPSLPVTSTREFIRLAKARPGQLNMGTSSIGGSSYLATELLKSMAGINLLTIPHKEAISTMTDTLRGEQQAQFSNDDTLVALLKLSKLRALGVTSAGPSLLFPALAPLSSTLPGFESASFLGLWAPAATPVPVINRLNQEIVRVLNRPETKEKFLAIGTEVVASTPAQFAAYIKAEMGKWGKVLMDAGIRPQ